MMADVQSLKAWVKKNTFDKERFMDRKEILQLKKEKGLKVSLVFPTLNEEKTIGTILESVRRNLRDKYPVVDECVVIDSGSTDQTAEVVARYSEFVMFHRIYDVLVAHGTFRGKGEGLWKSLFVTSGDIVIWCDSDITNFHYGFVTSTLGPLLLDDQVQFSKSFYHRGSEGSKVTELVARPLLNIYWPELAAVVQPLSGLYGGRRTCLERISFSTGYGVELETLIEVLQKFGLYAIAQADTGEFVHQSQTLEGLSRMSFAIMSVAQRKLDSLNTHTSYLSHRINKKQINDRLIVRPINSTGNSIAIPGNIHCFDECRVIDRYRQPMVEVKEYREKFGVIYDLL